MKTADFDFDLPDALIAQNPLAERSASRLLHYTRETDTIQHTQFKSLPDLLKSNDLLVMNDTEVIPARLYGQKETGGQVELLIERVLSDKNFIAHIKASKSPKPETLILLDTWQVRIIKKEDALYHCELVSEGSVYDMLSAVGHIPLPPYITREDTAHDASRYQTVYAKHKGSVAAPTAGLHFDSNLIEKLKAKGVNIAYVTLHVGAGTFQPVRVESLKDHKMHHEYYEIKQPLCDAILETKKQGGRVIAVGTTALRTLESAGNLGELKPHTADTNLFIFPGYKFKVCDGLITNFHLPKSTLLMLVAAFIGHAEMLQIYQTAVDEQYRFFSYGDASLLL